MKKNIKIISKTNRKVGQILGINVDSTSKNSVLTRVEDFISDSSKLGGYSKKFYIVTPNPELILMAQKNSKLKNSLNSADIAIPDGVGLKIADSSLNIIKGRELFMDLIKLASQKNWKVFLLGGLNNEAELAIGKLKEKYKNLEIESSKGPRLDDSAKPKTDMDERVEKDSIATINKFQPDLLFVAYGNPKQEIWINKNLGRLNTRGAMAVGGTFRYVSGLSPLPPEWMGRIGLEWLYRALTEPVRLGRILRAVIVFPLKVFLYKISQ